MTGDEDIHARPPSVERLFLNNRKALTGALQRAVRDGWRPS